jgi:foldase protein PrsA
MAKKSTTTNNKKKARIIFEERPKRTSWTTVAIGSAIIILLGLLIISNGTFFLFEKQETPAAEPVLLVSVNGEPIYESQLDLQWNTLPPETKMLFSRNDVLQQLIEEELLLQEAKNAGINITDAEVETFIATELTALGITEEVFTQYLATQGITREELVGLYKQQLTIQQLFQEEIEPQINVTEEEIEAYYEVNKDQFYQDDMVTVRHILIEVSDTFSQEQAQARVTEIMSQLENDFSNFCELVEQYSMDLGSAQQCGEYTFMKGQFNNPAFEDPAFNMSVNEVRVIETDFGLHIMLKTAAYPEQQLTLDDNIVFLPERPTLSDIIKEAVAEEKAQEAYTTYIQDILARSDIVYHDEALRPTNATTSPFEPSEDNIQLNATA